MNVFKSLMAGLTLCLFSTASVLAQVTNSDPWAHANSDIPADPMVRFGVLPNGLQYAVMGNQNPRGQASFRLRIDVGSLMENESQLGMAHFMEHMAFNGTTNIPENELLRILQRHGLAFRADTNAATGFDQTFYQLELPRTNDETVDAALRIMREQVSEALINPATVDEERWMIEGEGRTRNTPGLRSAKAQLALLAPGQRLSNRFPIGDLNIIRTAPRERFVEFYHAYYRPNRATFIAVGDFDVNVMEAKIRAAFESWGPKGPEGAEPDLGTVQPRGPQSSILVEPGVQSSIQLNWVRGPDLDPDTFAERRSNLIRNLGLAIFNRRLGEISRQANAPFLGAGADSSTVVDSLEIGGINASFNPGGWQRAFETIEQAQRRLVQFGVSEAELQREIIDTRAPLQNLANAAGTRTTPDLANGLLNAANNESVFTTPATNLALFNQAVQGLTAAQVNSVLPPVFEGQGPLVLVVDQTSVPGGELAVNAALRSSTTTYASRPVPAAPPTVATTYVNPDAQTCQRYGYAPGATGFADCMMQIDIARQAQARAAAEHNQRLAAYQQQVAQQERERRDERSMDMLIMGLRLMAGGSASGGSSGSAAPLPPPPQSTAPRTIRLPNGNQIYCQTIGNNTTCN